MYKRQALYALCQNVKTIIVADRQDSYGAGGGNMTLEIKAMLQSFGKGNDDIRVLSRIYGLGEMCIRDSLYRIHPMLSVVLCRLLSVLSM